MKEVSKWSWIKVAGNTKEEFNSKDFLNSKRFWIIDNETSQIFCLSPVFDTNNKLDYLDIPVILQNKEFINWAISTAPDLLNYLPKKLMKFKVVKDKLSNKIHLIEQYINGDDIPDYDIDDLEDDYEFMIGVIKHTKDKNMYELCSEKVKSTYEFILFMIEEFKCDIDFLREIVDYYLDNEREEVKRIEILIIMCDLLKDDVYGIEYSKQLADIYTTIKFNIEAIKNQPTMEFEAINELIQEGFYFILEDYKSSNVVMRYFTIKFMNDIIDEYNINLEKMIHNEFKEFEELERFGKIRYLINILNKYDTNLADYVICNLDLLSGLKIELDRVRDNWSLYSLSNDSKVKNESKVLKFVPKRKNDRSDT